MRLLITLLFLLICSADSLEAGGIRRQIRHHRYSNTASPSNPLVLLTVDRLLERFLESNLDPDNDTLADQYLETQNSVDTSKYQSTLDKSREISAILGLSTTQPRDQSTFDAIGDSFIVPNDFPAHP